jgi:hypothetical protein
MLPRKENGENMKYTVKYGVDSITKENQPSTTIGNIRENCDIAAALGFGDNINLLINGVAQEDGVLVPDGATVVVETAANQKA